MGTAIDRRRLGLAGLAVATMLLVAPHAARGATTHADAEISALLARPLTADAAVRIARLRQGLLEAVESDVAAARARRRQAGLLPNPELKVDLRRPDRASDAPQADLELELDLGHVLTLPARRSVAEAGVDVARHAADRYAVELTHGVRVAFYAVQSAERRWRNAVVALETVVAAREAARALHAAGNLTALEAERHAAESERLRAEVAELELAYHDSRERLQPLLGLHGAATAWQVAPPSEALPPETTDLGDVERRAVEANHELARMRAELTALARAHRLARIEGWMPGLAVDVHAERDETEWETGGGVRVSLPLFDRRQGERAARIAEQRALERRLHATAVDLRAQARAARNRAISGAARARHWRERVLPARRRVVEQTLLQHNAMQADVFELLEARRAEAEAERRASDAFFEALVARCELDALLEGAPIGGRPASDSARADSTNDTLGGH